MYINYSCLEVEMRFRTLSMVFFSIMLLAGCAGSSSSAAKPVESYLQAVVDQDVTRLETLVCQDWQASALLELDAFMGVEADLENVTCTEQENDGSKALVSCSGNIVATYNNEQQRFPLEGRVYKMVKQGGDWLVCGYP